MTGVSNLMSVAKVLYDKSFLEVVKENASLKLELFWRDHHIRKLKKAMWKANFIYCQCNCLSCAVSGRIWEDQTPTDMQCKFKPWFEGQLESLGMIVQRSTFKDDKWVHTNLSGSIEYIGEAEYDDNCHFFCCSESTDWFCFTYGSKLWRAKSVNDMELLKLKSLFDILTDRE